MSSGLALVALLLACAGWATVVAGALYVKTREWPPRDRRSVFEPGAGVTLLAVLLGLLFAALGLLLGAYVRWREPSWVANLALAAGALYVVPIVALVLVSWFRGRLEMTRFRNAQAERARLFAERAHLVASPGRGALDAPSNQTSVSPDARRSGRSGAPSVEAR